MEQQRPLRLGDLVDDYCPRERRITNHAIVAIVEDAIRQTRCTACEADHVYKGGKAPVRKKPARTKEDEQAVLYDQVLANVTGGTLPPPEPVAVPVPVVVAAPPPVPGPIAESAPHVVAAAPAAAEPDPAAPVIDEGWSLNRRLIRASLPRNDSQPPPPRAIPEFTMHQRNVRGSQQFRGGGGNGNGSGYGGSGGGWHDRSSQGANGNSNGHRGGFRPDPQGQGQGEGQPGSPNGQRPGGGRRRRRHKTPRPPQN